MSSGAREGVPAYGAAADPRTRNAGRGLVLLAAALWSTSGLFIKIMTLGPVPITGLRSAVAALAMAPFVRRRGLQWEPALLVLALAYTWTQLGFVAATKWTTAANAIALQSTAPAWVFLFGCLVARQVPWRLLPPVLLVLAGIAAMLAEPVSGTSMLGNLLGLSTGLTFAVVQVTFSRLRTPAVAAIGFSNLVAALVCVAVQPAAFLAPIPAGEWAALVYLGCFQLALPFLCFTSGVRRIPVTQASLLSVLEPLLNPIWVFWVVGEVPSAYGFAGAACILAGIVLDVIVRRS